MPLIDRNGPTRESWVAVNDDAPAGNGDIIVSFARLKAEGDQLLARAGRLGVAVPSDVAIEDLARWLPSLALVVIRFAGFKDGRPYTLARLLRTRLGFAGELRSEGHILPDQAQFLVRAGFTTFSVPDTFDVRAFLGALSAYTHTYQAPADALLPIMAARRIDRLTGYSANATDLLSAAIRSEFRGRIAVVSAFGAESAVLLYQVAAIDPTTPVLFLETGKHFPETLAYRDVLVSRLGLTQVRSLQPSPAALAVQDPKGDLWSRNVDACCALRKVDPLAEALTPFEAWVTGRKAYQGGARDALPAIEWVDGKFKINPLAAWSAEDVAAYAARHDLPAHPLVSLGYRSIGCAPCTRAVANDEAPRAGRWSGSPKTECGIHAAPTRRVAP